MINEIRIFDFVSEIGTLLIECDAETLRVTETMNIIAKSLGLKNLDSFITANGLLITSKLESQTLSLSKHIKTRDANLGKVESINSLSRKIVNKEISLDEAEILLKKIKTQKTWSTPTRYVSAALGCSALTILYGGSYMDSFISLLISVLIRYIIDLSTKYKINRVMSNLFSSTLISLLAIFFYKISLVDNIDKVIIGSITPLLPGLILTIGIRDITNNDYLSGIIRVIEAILVASSIAVGVGLVFHFL